METQRLERKNHCVRWLTAAAPPATTITTINLIVAHDIGAFGYNHQFFRLPFAQIYDKIKVLVVAVVGYGFCGIGELMDESGGGSGWDTVVVVVVVAVEVGWREGETEIDG
ncbi:hypothetical protein Hanom_Chr03g00199651 [Helianthus anomalus]